MKSWPSKTKMQQRNSNRARGFSNSSLLLGLKGGRADWIKHLESIAIYTGWDLGAGTIKYHLFHQCRSFGLHINGCYFTTSEWLSEFWWAILLIFSTFASSRLKNRSSFFDCITYLLAFCLSKPFILPHRLTTISLFFSLSLPLSFLLSVVDVLGIGRAIKLRFVLLANEKASAQWDSASWVIECASEGDNSPEERRTYVWVIELAGRNGEYMRKKFKMAEIEIFWVKLKEDIN